MKVWSYLHGIKKCPHKIVTKHNFIVDNPGAYNLNQMIKVNITTNMTNQY